MGSYFPAKFRVKIHSQVSHISEIMKTTYCYLVNQIVSTNYVGSTLLMLLLLGIVSVQVEHPPSDHHFLEYLSHLPHGILKVIILSAAILALALLIYVLEKQPPIYLIDFSCYKPGDHRKASPQLLEYFARRSGISDQNLQFLKRVYLKSGIGDETYLPPFIFHDPPIEPSMQQGRLESEEVMYATIDELMKKTQLQPKDIDILIVNSSCFNPTPSLASMIVNHYKLKSSVLTFNLGGMGCSAGMIAIDLAKRLLGTLPNSYAVVVSTENITMNWYRGNNKTMLVPNCLFRVGGSSILLSNKASDRSRAKYKLHCTVRTHIGADDNAFRSVYQQEDVDGLVGVSLSKGLMLAAADAMKKNMTVMGPLVLPFSEQLRFLISLLSQKISKNHHGNLYIPNFKLAFHHFLIHSGGRAVLDAVQKELNLSDEKLEPSRMTLHRFGNLSSSSLLYALSYLEAKERIYKGEHIWLLGLGGGFKCNSVVLKALRTVKKPSLNPWLDSLHRYPVTITTEMTDIIRSEKLFYRTNSGKLFDCVMNMRVGKPE